MVPRSESRSLVLLTIAALGMSVLSLPVGGATHDSGLFELDGNATDGVAAGDDWSAIFPANLSTTVYSRTFASDVPAGDTTYFSISSKDINDVSTWSATGTSAPDKDEITDAYAATYKVAGNTTVISFGADRYANNGDSAIGFWFLQNRISVGSAGAFTGTHAVNDTLIVSHFTNGGAVSTITVYRWVATTPHLQLVTTSGDCASAASNDNLCAAVNAGAASSPWAYTPKQGASGSFPGHSFFEGGINLTAVYPTAPCFTNFLAETRSSQETTATLKDFVLHSFNNCPIVPPLSAFDLLKTAVDPAIDLGETMAFDITLTNGGPDPATDVNITDALPAISGSWSLTSGDTGPCSITGIAGAQTLTCAFGTLGVFETRSLRISASTSAPGDCGLQTNTVHLTANDGLVDDNSTATVYVTCADVSVTKTVTESPVSLGTGVEFQITLFSNGPDAADNATLADPLPAIGGPWSVDDQANCAIAAGTLACDFGTVPAGESRAIRVSTPTSAPSDCGSWPNTATVSARLDTDASNNAASATAIVLCPELSIVKTADAASVSAGSDIGFTITVTNGGAGTATAVTLDDPLPTGSGISWTDGSASCDIAADVLTCDFGDLGSGASASVHVGSSSTFDSCAAYPNTATASASNHADVAASDTTTVLCPALNIAKTADAASVSAGDDIGFTIAVANAGSGTAAGVVLSDALPTGAGVSWSVDVDATGLCAIAADTLTCSYGDLGPGDSRTVHVTSATSFASCGAYPNTASASASNHAEVTATDTTTVLCPDLGVVKTADAASVSAGSDIGFAITVSNAGPGVAKAVTLSDPLPTGAGVSWSIDNDPSSACGIAADTLSCDWGDLAAAGSGTVHVTSGTTSASCQAYENTATASASNHADVTATDTTTVLCSDPSIVKTADAATVNAGEAIGFTITVTNGGLGVATGVTLSDPLPTGAGVSWSTTSAGCSVAAGTLSCSFGDLGPGDSASARVTSPTTFDSCKAYENTATASASNHGDVTASDTTTVQCPSLGVTKTADAESVSAGSAIGFTITVTNGGPGTAKAVTLSDPLPAGSGIAWSTSSAGCSIAAGTLSCVFGDLASGGSASAHVTSPTTIASCQEYPNTASASASNHATVTASATTTVLCPDLGLTKTADAASVPAGSPIGFTLVVSNTGSGTETNVVLTDPLPTGAGISWSVDVDTTGLCAIVAGTLSCSYGDLAPGDTRTVHVTSPTTTDSCKVYPNTATATNQQTVTASATTTVTCPVGNATRTLGFWATHTAYTESVFDANFSGAMTIGSGTHLRTIDSYGKLFGSWLSSVSYKTTGQKRSAPDHSRMVLLQQITAAKLNCAAFGCAPATLSLISQADVAYGSNDRALMASLTAQLDAYNSSGDSIGVGPTGSATPALSLSIANNVFWDNP